MKTVSPFELAIVQIVDLEGAKSMRAETEEEKNARLSKKFNEFFKDMKVRPESDVKKAYPIY